MLGLVVAVLSVVLPLVHLALTGEPHTEAHAVKILLLYALVIDVGVSGVVLRFIPHISFPDQAAKMIGWSPTPFRFEVGVHDGAWGVLGFCASGSAACSGSRPGSAGCCSCSVPRSATSIR